MIETKRPPNPTKARLTAVGNAVMLDCSGSAHSPQSWRPKRTRPEIKFDTTHIGFLREVLDKNSSLRDAIGPIVQFRIVVDANFVIQDLTQHVRYPERGATALEELVKATVVEVFAPRWLDSEMASAIPQVAAKRKLPEEELWAHWMEYRTLLKWDETYLTASGDGESVVDPKDMPYVQLEKAIGAHGILSQDRHIEKMGGNRLTLDFVLSTRSYARATVVTLGLRVCGLMLGVVALKALMKLLQVFGRVIGKLPDSARAILLVSIIAALAHPGARKWIYERFTTLAATVKPVLDGVWDGIVEGARISNEKRGEANEHLLRSVAALGKPKPI